MITHERLTEEVTRCAALTETKQATHVIRVVLGTLAHRLEMPQRQRLHMALPGPERDAAYATAPPSEDGVTGLLAEVGRHLDAPPERALFLAQAVLSRVAEADPDLGWELRDHLPEDYAPLFTPPPAYPERMHTATDAPAPLAADELAAALRARPQWTGSTSHVTRTVGMAADRLPPLLNAVRQAAQDLRHRADWELTRDGITFTLRTRSVDAVTPVDLQLADRIDTAVEEVGSGGHPG